MLMMKDVCMEDEFVGEQATEIRDPSSRGKIASPSTEKTRRTMRLAVLFHMSWPLRLSKDEILS
jgi:hypothetical protein